LSEIAPNFGRLFALLIFRGQAAQNLCPNYHVAWKSFVRLLPLVPKL